MFHFFKKSKLCMKSLIFDKQTLNNILENYFEYKSCCCIQRRYLFKSTENKSDAGSDNKEGIPSKEENGNGDSKEKYKSIVRHNFTPDCENAINKQINMELYAAYWYTSLQHHFDRDDIALLGFSKYFKAAAAEELVHAENLMVFQMKRGGQLKYLPIEPPPVVDWTAACAVAESMELEKLVTKSLEDLAQLASDKKDDHLNDYICGQFLTEQFQAIKDLADLLSRIKRAGPGAGLVIIDGELQEKFKK